MNRLRSLAPIFLGAFSAVVVSIVITLLWRSQNWPGRMVAAPAGFFFVMGFTFAHTSPRWRGLSVLRKLGIASLYALFGAVMVGGLSALLRP